MELDRLLKLLRMTTSSHDNEALNAIRLANKYLTDHASSWDLLLTTASATGTGSTTGKSNGKRKPTIDLNDPLTPWDDVIDTILDDKPYMEEKWRVFLQSVRTHYAQKGRLSEKQMKVVRGFAVGVDFD